ncbi:zinc-binding dehydrogenase, partial [Acidianus sp. RZ1]|uniref:zinc-binding dehydrogenase n=1 Tax=Acidianus sp. RZ1 TaxID=1540082 RepID=UPI001490BE09
MKALVLEKPGLENLKLKDLDVPNGEGVLVKIVIAGLTMLDYMSVSKGENTPVIPGVEFAGIIEEGEMKGKKASIYTRTFDGTCKMCKREMEMFCLSGKRMGIDVNGGFEEYIRVPRENLVVSDLPWETLASMSISALAPYHALKTADIKRGDTVVVLGASGNSGIFSLQIAERLGARVIGITNGPLRISRYTFTYDEAEERVKEITDGEKADVVINQLGASKFPLALKLVRKGGKIVVFGTMQGKDTNLDLSWLYLNHVSIIGTVRGTLKEMMELAEICKDCNPYVWKELALEDGSYAL